MSMIIQRTAPYREPKTRDDRTGKDDSVISQNRFTEKQSLTDVDIADISADRDKAVER